MAKYKVAELPPGVKMCRTGRRRWLEIEFGGKTKSLSQWAAESGMKEGTLYRRIVIEREEFGTALFRPPAEVDRHGMSDSPERRVWHNMIQRCLNAKTKSYKDYGGRGIRVCGRWLEAFSNFFADMGPRPSPQHTLERKDNDKDYEPGNCCWATRVEQSRNNRRNVRLEFNGQTKVLTDWAKENGLTVTVLWKRLFKLGWTVEQALTTPTHGQRTR